MEVLREYEILIVLTEELNDSELKTWVFNYAKNLRRFNVQDISVVSRGKHKLAYFIVTNSRASYIQLNFASVPKYISRFLKKLNRDPKVLRYLTIKRK